MRSRASLTPRTNKANVWHTVRSALALLGILGALVGAGCGSSRTYSIEEAQYAFKSQGFDVQVSRVPVVQDYEGGALLPQSGEPFVVIVTATDSEVDKFWSDYERMQDASTFDARRANVAAISDFGLKPKDRRRVLAALSALPDRGAQVEVADR